MWKSAYVGVYQLLNWKMHGETLKCQTNVCLPELCYRFHLDIFLLALLLARRKGWKGQLKKNTSRSNLPMLFWKELNITLLRSLKAVHYWGISVCLVVMNTCNKWSAGSLADLWIFKHVLPCGFVLTLELYLCPGWKEQQIVHWTVGIVIY